MHADKPPIPLKRDVLGRVTTPKAQREVLLDEFERSGMKGKPFAKLVGVNYQTFAVWIQKRRRARGDYQAIAFAAKANAARQLPVSASPLRLLEAVLTPSVNAVATDTQAATDTASAAPALEVMLGGGAKLLIADARQVALAAQLINSLRVPC